MKGKIIKIKSVLHNNTCWYVTNSRLDPEGVYVMDVIRLRKRDYALYRGMAYRNYIAATLEEIEIMTDADAVKMMEIYGNEKNGL